MESQWTMISLKVLCLLFCMTAMESTAPPAAPSHSDYYHSVVVKGHVKDSYPPQDLESQTDGAPVAAPDDHQPALTIADSPSRRSREYYPHNVYPPTYEYYDDDGAGHDYYTGVEATYHPLSSSAVVLPHHEVTQRGRALVAHHGKLVRGLFGFAGHHGGHVISPLGLASHHGGLIKTHSGLAGHHSKLLHNSHGGVLSHGGFILGRSANPPSPIPEMPGLIRGGAAIAAYNTHDLNKEKQIHGQGAHKYKHFSVDKGFINPCVSRPFHVVHADHGYDSNVINVGGGGYAGANNVYGLGGRLGIL